MYLKIKNILTISYLLLLLVSFSSCFLLPGTPKSKQEELSVVITTSRVSGTAPLAVFFDGKATIGLGDNDYINAHFDWDFDDPEGSHNTLRGFIAGHVFETPGEYEVIAHCIDKDGKENSSTVTIEVLPMEGITYYVANSGDDGNSGTIDSPFKSLDKAISLVDTNVEILLNRGDTFAVTNYKIDTTGPVNISSYGEGELPCLESTNNNWGVFHLSSSSSDIRIYDIKILGTNHDRHSSEYQRGFALQGDHGLVLRTEIENVCADATTVGGGSTNNFIIDNRFTNYASYGCFNDGSNIAFIGNESSGQDGTEHFYRTQNGVNQYIAKNYFHDYLATKSSIQVRGDGTMDVAVMDNYVTMPIGVNPQNDEQEEYVSKVLVEGNYCDRTLVIAAKNVTVRNNILNSYIKLYDHPLVGIPDHINIYNNTLFSAENYGLYGSVKNIDIKNNCFYSTTTEGYAYVFALKDAASNRAEIDNNLSYYPNKNINNNKIKDVWNAIGGADYSELLLWQSAGWEPNSLFIDPNLESTLVGDSQYLVPKSDSPLIDAGADIPVFTDYLGNFRTDGAIDIGAFEK